LENTQQEYEETVWRINTEKSELNNAVLETLDVLAAHKAYIHDNLAALAKFYSNTKVKSLP
jgi:hypothetical protein